MLSPNPRSGLGWFFPRTAFESAGIRPYLGRRLGPGDTSGFEESTSIGGFIIGGVSQTPWRGAWREGHSASGTRVFLSRASPVNRAPPPPPPRSPEIPRDRVSAAGPLRLGSTVLGASSEAPFLSAHPLQKKKKLSFLVIQYFIHLFVYPLQTPYCGL